MTTTTQDVPSEKYGDGRTARNNSNENIFYKEELNALDTSKHSESQLAPTHSTGTYTNVLHYELPLWPWMEDKRLSASGASSSYSLVPPILPNGTLSAFDKLARTKLEK